jgi:tetratricopeptide (TPR) repeat protein
LRPHEPTFQFQRAWSLLEVPHRRVEAIAAFDSLLKLSPSSFGYYLMGCGLQKERRNEEAVQAFDEAARLDPRARTDPDYCYNYGLSLASIGRLEDAAEAFRDSALLKPSQGEAWGFLGLMFMSIGRWTDAVPCLERAMRLAPSALHGGYLGWTLLWLNRLDEAERALRNTLLIDSRATDVKLALAQVLAGQDRHDEALTIAHEVCAVTPVAMSSQLVLAEVLRDAGRLEEALKEANAAAMAWPSEPGPQVVLGTIHVDLNDGAAALAAFDRVQRCVELSHESQPASFHVSCARARGNALSLLGRHEEAMCAFEETLRRDPDHFDRWPDGRAHYDCSLRETQRGAGRQ